MHEPLSRQMFTTTALGDTSKELHIDIEARSTINLTKCGMHIYAADPSTKILCLSFGIGKGPVQRWFPGDPVPDVWFEVANDPNWTAFAHNALFEMTIGKLILSQRHGFPVIPDNQYRCTQAASLALGLPAKLKLLANVMEFKHRKDEAGERLMHAMTKPRKPKAGEDPNGVYWVDDPDGSKILRLINYNCQDVEVEREADGRVGRLSMSRRSGYSVTGSTSVVFMSTARSPKPRSRSPKPPGRRLTRSWPGSPTAPSKRSTRSRK